MKKINQRFFMQILMLFIALNLHFSVYGQTAETSSAKTKGFQELKLDSKLMKREMPYRVILPVSYEVNADNRFPVIYLLHGLTGHYDYWTNQSKLVEYARNYEFIIVTPDGDNGWYCDSATVADDKYESYIIQELVREIER
jgi:S-formylglutathione hydrolase FrmB